MNKLISIIIPTYNRAEYIGYTLSLLRSQIERNNEDVELIVCINASTDNTEDILNNIDQPFFRVIKYDHHVEVGVSISRSIENATGKYVLVWGDDDIPSPVYVDMLLHYVKEHPDLSFIHCNQMSAYDYGDLSVSSMTIANTNYKKDFIIYESSQEFAQMYWASIGIISSNLIKKSSWDIGVQFDSSTHYGWEFVAPFLIGTKNQKCAYINFPSWIQRNPIYRKWLHLSPYYWFVGIPNLLKDLDKEGVLNDWRNIWKNVVSFRSHIQICMQMSLNRSFYFKHLKEIFYYQESVFRKFIILAILLLFPKFLYNWFRKLYFSNT